MRIYFTNLVLFISHISEPLISLSFQLWPLFSSEEQAQGGQYGPFPELNREDIFFKKNF